MKNYHYFYCSNYSHKAIFFILAPDYKFMEKKQKQIIIALVVAVLILATFIIWKNTMASAKIDTLEVTGRVSGSYAGCYPQVTFSQYVKRSVLVVSATVTESKEEWDTPDGNPWQFDPENPRPGEGPSDHYYKECYLDVNEVLKGNFEINRILFKTNTITPEFKVGEEYVLLITISEQGDYKAIGPFLLKNGSVYQGTTGSGFPSISKTYDELKRAIFISKLNPF